MRMLTLAPSSAQGEFGRLAKTLGVEKLHLPTIKDAQKIKNNLDKRKEYILTEVRCPLPQLGSAHSR